MSLILCSILNKRCHSERQRGTEFRFIGTSSPTSSCLAGLCRSKAEGNLPGIIRNLWYSL